MTDFEDEKTKFLKPSGAWDSIEEFFFIILKHLNAKMGGFFDSDDEDKGHKGAHLCHTKSLPLQHHMK